MNKDQVKGRIEEVKGKTKEITGKIVGNTDLEQQGKNEILIGKIHTGYGDLKNNIKVASHGKLIIGLLFTGAIILASSLVMPALSFATDSTTDTTGEYLDDAAITAKVKTSFAEDKWVKGRDISVRTDHGVVDLTGSVGSTDESDRATKLATNIKSVKAVHNNLKVDLN